MIRFLVIFQVTNIEVINVMRVTNQVGKSLFCVDKMTFTQVGDNEKETSQHLTVWNILEASLVIAKDAPKCKELNDS